jgi:hypothetical protein
MSQSIDRTKKVVLNDYRRCGHAAHLILRSVHVERVETGVKFAKAKHQLVLITMLPALLATTSTWASELNADA